MFLILLVLTALPLLFLNSFGKLALVSAYAGLAHIVLLAGIVGLLWFGLHYEAICRVWRRRRR